jgi:hypothetical protein
MLFSFVYLVFVSLLRLLSGFRRPAEVKDIELLVLRPSPVAVRGSSPGGRRPRIVGWPRCGARSAS